MANAITVAVSADVTGLVANRAVMSAELKAIQRDLNDTAKVAARTGLTEELQKSMMSSAEGVARLTTALDANKAKMAAAKAAQIETAAATTTETVAVEANTAAHVNNRAAREGLVLIHEALSGNYRRMAGSAMIEAQALMSSGSAAGIAAAAFSPLGIAVIAATATLGFLVYREYEVEQATNRMTEAFALTGRGATNSADAVRAEVDAIDDMPGVSQKAAEALVEFDAAHANVNARISEAANQLAPQFVQAFGKDGPEALNRLKSSLADIENSTLTQAIGKFNELNSTMLGLKPGEVEMIEGLIQAGDRIGAVNRILADLAAQSGGHFQTINQQVIGAQVELAKAKANAAALMEEVSHPIDPQGLMAITLAASKADERVQQLEGRVRQLQAEAAATPEHGETYEAAFAQSHATLESLRDSASRAKDAVAELHREMEQRRAVNKNDPEVVDYFAHQAKVDSDLMHREDPGDYKKPKVHKEAGESPMTAMENTLRQSEFDIRSSTGAWQSDMSAMEAKYWQDKLAKAKEGSKLYGEIQSRLQEAETRAGTRSAAQQRQMSMSDSQTTLAVSKSQIKDQEQAASSGFEQRLAGIKQDPNSTAGISADDKYKAMVDAAQAEAAAEIKAQEDKKQAQADDVAAVHDAANQEVVINQDLQSKLSELERQHTADVQRESQARTQAEKEAARQQEQAHRQMVSNIESMENQLVSGILGGRQSLTQILGRLALSAAEKSIEADLHYLTEHKMMSAEQLAADRSASQGGLLTMLLASHKKIAQTQTETVAQTAATQAGAAAQTAAVAAGATAQTTAKTAGVAASSAIGSAANKGEITSNAMVAGSGAFKALAGIPVVGPILAPAAMTAAISAVSALAGSAGFAKGINSMPSDAIALVHAGERIVPRSDNQAIMDAVSRGTGKGGQSGGDIHAHFAPTIHNPTGRATVKELRDQQDDFVAYLRSLRRDGHI